MQVLFCRSNPINPDPRVEKEAQALAEAGMEVQAVAWDRSGRLPAEEEKEGLLIHRLSIPADFGHGMANFPSLIRWQLQLFSWLFQQRRGYDVIHACDFDTILPAMLCKLLFGKKVVYDIFDFYADHLRATPSWIKRFIRSFDLMVIGWTDAVILVDEARKTQINGAAPRNLIYIYNSPDDKRWSGKTDDYSSGFRITYVGLLQVERGLFDLLEVMKRHPEWHLDMAGFGGDEKEIASAANTLTNVTYHSRIPYEKTLALSERSDALIATYDPAILNHRFSSPNKIFEAMMLSKPIVVSSNTNMDDIIIKNNCGLVVPYGDVEALDAAFSRLASDQEYASLLGANGRIAYDTKYGWPIMRERLVDLYKNLRCIS